jgi:putative FmdB family regulatory protein
MPIYEYKATGKAHCKKCKDKFEVRQGMNDEPMKSCPECGAEVSRLFSRPFLWRKESPSEEESVAPHAGEEAGELGLEEGFGEDEDWG